MPSLELSLLLLAYFGVVVAFDVAVTAVAVLPE